MDEELAAGIKKFLDKCPDDVALDRRTAPVRIQWSRAGTGFGELYFYYDNDGVLRCENECMSKEFVKQVLCDLVDKAVFDDVG